ncbi:mitochondrial import inner membrane translocase subunit Tim17-B [Pundamilia nyererei]|uniref:Mitochondrial import inner membrane translocase subunit Tim17-B n=1 Tax=Pundamilia nyererei TaxID=303518 RepID=A0A9Y3QZE6_9CICH|nr:PREDICTED: mitochondrial import inner membrane translocase subunit Tim17-B [Pundamilia nyererei]
MEEYAREPCPWRIVDDCGGAFTMGAIGGGVFQAVKGFRNAPAGVGHRLKGSAKAVRVRAPQIGVLVFLVSAPQCLSTLCSLPSRLHASPAEIAKRQP